MDTYKKALIGGLVAAAAIWLILWPAVDGTGSPAPAAELLQAAVIDLEEAKAIHIVTRVDDGPATAVIHEGEIWSVDGLGYRSENDSWIEVYNASLKKHIRRDRASGEVEIVPEYESSLGYEFLRRGRQDENVEYLIALARQGVESFRDEHVALDGRTIRRLSCMDEHGLQVIVEIDPDKRQILKTESWVRPTEENPAQRVVTTYDHLDRDQVNPSLFEIEVPDNNRRGIAAPTRAAVTQCMTNLRDLTAALWDYEGKHQEEGLPADLMSVLKEWSGYRESMLHCPLLKSTGRLQYSLGPEFRNAKSVLNINGDVVVFECELHEDVTLQSYGGGHVMSISIKRR